MKGYMYILKCADGSYYTGSTKDLRKRLLQHQSGEGANYTKKRLPVELVYYEEYDQIDQAFYREKQVQGWSRKKKEALINGQYEKLPELSRNYTQYRRRGNLLQSEEGTSTSSVPDDS
ncbi:MAG: GIY-YIG nuclease family protein [Calditrichaeota bacterium]|nr:GIY-YIG nuclease family protein [Calditrichota bacterium]